MLVFVGTCLAVVKYATRPITNTDTYFHLRFGSEFLSSWGLRDPGSVTPFATRDWLPTQWLTQVVMARTEDAWGLAGVTWLAGTWYLLFAVALYVAARREASALAASIITLFALAAAQPALSPRPQVLSYVFVVVFTVAWLGSLRDGRPRWWLVPLTWLWVLVHGMWPLAILIGVVAATAALLERNHPLGVRLRLFLVPLLCAVAAAVTPLGPAAYGAVVQVGSYAQYFSEWASPDFRNPMAYLTGAMVGLAMLVRLRRADVMPWGELAFLFMAAGAAVYSYRTLPVAVAIVTPILAAAVAPLLAPQPVRRWEKLTVAGALVGCMILLAVMAPSSAGRGGGAPAWIPAELEALPDHTVVLNDSEWGGYLMWAYPTWTWSPTGTAMPSRPTRSAQRRRLLASTRVGQMVEESGATVALVRPAAPSPTPWRTSSAGRSSSARATRSPCTARPADLGHSAGPAPRR